MLSRIQTFLANYAWSSHVKYIDGWIPRFAFFFPVIGYLILFNDEISDFFTFQNLANSTVLDTGLSGSARLKLLYFGLFFLGASNLIYKLKKPYGYKFGNNFITYGEVGFKHFTLGDYIQIHGRIRNRGHATLDGKYYDSEWQGFLEAAKNSGEGTENVERDGNWEDAKKQYGNLLLSILRDNFSYIDMQNRNWLSLCIFLSTCGYLLMLLPSLDIFIKVVKSTFI